MAIDSANIELIRAGGFFFICVALIRVLELVLGKWVHDRNGGRDLAEVISKQNALSASLQKIERQLAILVDRGGRADG